MGECIFENPGNFMLDSYQLTPKKLPLTFLKSTGMSQDFFGAQSNNFFIHAELDYFDQILQEHFEDPTKTLNETKDYLALAENLSGLKGDKKPQLNLRQAPCQFLQKLQKKRINLVLVATSLDENDVVQKLKGNLDPKTFSMIPLSFDENNNAVNQFNSELELMSLKREGNTDYGIKPERPESKNKLRPKRTTAPQKDEKYWKRRTSNNDAARRSREAKRARFAWIQNRVNELEVENANLQKELEGLEQKVLEAEKKAD